MDKEKLIKEYEDIFISSLKEKLPNHDFELDEQNLIIRPWINEPYQSGKIRIEKLKEMNISAIEEAIFEVVQYNRNIKIDSILFEFKH